MNNRIKKNIRAWKFNTIHKNLYQFFSWHTIHQCSGKRNPVESINKSVFDFEYTIESKFPLWNNTNKKFKTSLNFFSIYHLFKEVFFLQNSYLLLQQMQNQKLLVDFWKTKKSFWALVGEFKNNLAMSIQKVSS